MSDWIDLLFDDLEDEKPSFGKLSFIDALIRNATLNEDMKQDIESELNDMLTNERASEIIQTLLENQMNMHDSGSYTATNIAKYLDKCIS